jgi:hypothetical protein
MAVNDCSCIMGSAFPWDGRHGVARGVNQSFMGTEPVVSRTRVAGCIKGRVSDIPS